MIDDKLVRWRCRRGMKELDVMLERFLGNGYESLTTAEKSAFAGLLDALDPDLFAWLSGADVPEAPELRHVVAVIRDNLTGTR